MRPPVSMVGAILMGAVSVLVFPAAAAPEEVPTQEQVEAFKDGAEKLMIESQRRVAETAHVVAMTDAPQEEVAAMLAANLEGVFAASYRLFHNAFPARPDSPKLHAYLFTSEAQYRLLGAPSKSWGAYLSPGLIAFHQERFSPPELRNTAIHEGVHAYLDMYVSKPGIELPMWLHEGLASYMQHSIVESGVIQPGLFYQKERYEAYGSAIIDTSIPLLMARDVDLKKGKLPVEELLLPAGHEDFQRRGAARLYRSSWALVHFLRHGPPDGSKKFLALVRDLAGGTGFEDALLENYDMTIAELESAAGDYVKTTLTQPPANPRGSLRGRPAAK